MILRGLDEDWSKVNPAQAYNDGFRFIIGYVSQDTTGKNLSASDVQRIRQGGLAVGLVYEYNPQSALGGYAQGVTDAQIAVAHARSIGAPQGVALYAAVDWNVTTSQMVTVLAYATAFLTVCQVNGFRSGVYGGLPICQYLYQHNYSGFLWQTYAWSGVPPVWLSVAAVRQTLNGVFEAGATIDLDESEAPDFGQWQGMGDEMATVLLSIEMQDNTVRSGPTDGLGHFHWIPDQAALQEYQAATGLAIRVVTQDMAFRAYGIDFSTPPAVTIGAVSVSGALTLTPKV